MVHYVPYSSDIEEEEEEEEIKEEEEVRPIIEYDATPSAISKVVDINDDMYMEYLQMIQMSGKDISFDNYIKSK